MQRTREERKCFGYGDFEYIAYHCKNMEEEGCYKLKFLELGK